MARLVFAPSAIADAREILTTLVEKAGQPVAAAYWDRFQSTFKRVAAFPQSGVARPRLGELVRIAVIRSYVVIYRTNANVAEVVRIIHDRRNITRRLLAR
jgi:plasmid stabilization system protein ParE